MNNQGSMDSSYIPWFEVCMPRMMFAQEPTLQAMQALYTVCQSFCIGVHIPEDNALIFFCEWTAILVSLVAGVLQATPAPCSNVNCRRTRPMILNITEERKLVWRCTVCTTRRTIYHQTIFKHANLPIHKILRGFYYLLNDVPLGSIENMLRISHKTTTLLAVKYKMLIESDLEHSTRNSEGKFIAFSM